MRINTNVSSITAQEAAVNTNKEITNSLAKLSSGLRINKASDDASGLAIADKLRTQATSINQGVSNGNSAITLLQIADKSMAEQSNILDTIKAKLIQANTDTTSDDGRESIRKDIVKLLTQLDNIAEQTNYNGNVLLQNSATDTSASSSLSFQIGEGTSDTISNTSIQSNTAGLGGGASSVASGTTLASGASIELKESNAGAITLTTTTSAGASGAEAVELSGDVGSLAAASGTTITNMDAETAEILESIADNSSDFAWNATTSTFTMTNGVAVDLDGVDVAYMDVTSGTAAGTIALTTDQSFTVKNDDSTSGNTLTITGAAMVGGELLSSLSGLAADELTKANAEKYQSVVDNAITDLNGYRGDIGSTQNQVESAVRNLMTQSTNVKAAESIIRDVDYAAESANFNKQNIISQAGSYAISQANSVQQNVLRLLQ